MTVAGYTSFKEEPILGSPRKTSGSGVSTPIDKKLVSLEEENDVFASCECQTIESKLNDSFTNVVETITYNYIPVFIYKSESLEMAFAEQPEIKNFSFKRSCVCTLIDGNNLTLGQMVMGVFTPYSELACLDGVFTPATKACRCLYKAHLRYIFK